MAGPIRIDVLVNSSNARRALAGVAVGLAAAGAAALKFAQAAAEDQRAAAAMAQTFQRSAGATDAQVASVEKWITAQGRAKGVADDDLRPALSRLVTATGDVGEAQRLAALAMDVSAATGKSLESVSTGLMKAQNGQVSSLARLGINTKNAAGETLTFDQAVRSMTNLFGGAAATQADTYSGKLQRAGVVASEAGEAIGAVLLPPMADLATVVADKAVPALEKTVAWFQRNQDEIRGTAQAVGGVLLPPLRLLGDTVRGLAGFLGGIPGPVREVGVQAALAAVILPRLATAALTVTTNLRFAGAAAGVFGAQMRTAAGRAAAAQAVMTRLAGAAKFAAGVGGMLALSSAAQDTSKEMGALKGAAGGALLGFSVGGPWGAALGAGAGLLFGLSTAGDDASVSMQGLTDTLNKQTGAITRATDEALRWRLEEAGVLKAAQSLGLSLSDVTQAALGNESALSRVNSGLAAMKASMVDADGRMIASIGVREAFRENSALVTSAVEGTSGALSEGAAAIARFNESGRQGGKGLQEIAYGADLAVKAQALLAQSADKAATEVYRLKDAVAALSATLDRRSSLRDYQAALDAFTAGLKANGRSLDINTAKGRENQANLDNIAQSALKVAENLKGPRRIAFLQGVREDFRGIAKISPAVARQLGIIDDEIVRLSRREVNTPIDADKRPFDKKKRDTQRDLDRLDRERPTPRAGLDDREARGKVAGLRRDVDELGARRPTPVVSVNDRATGVIGNISRAISNLRDKTITITTIQNRVNRITNSVQNFFGGGAAGRSLADSAGVEGLTAGRALAVGVARGLTQGQGRAAAAGDQLVRAIVAAARKGSVGDALRGYLKSKGVEDKRIRAVVKSLGGETRALGKNMAAQRRLNEQVANAVRNQNAYAASVKQSVIESGSLTSLGEGAGFGSAGDLVTQMREKLARAKAYAAMIAKLTKQGLNKTSLKQLIDAGVEGGFGTAETLLSGGKSTIAQINQITRELTSVGGKFGKQSGEAVSGSFVRGLKRQQKELDRIGDRWAANIARQLRNAVRNGSGGGGRASGRSGSRARDVYEGQRGGGGNAGGRVIQIRLSAQEVSQLQRGREYKRDIRAYERAGGK